MHPAGTVIFKEGSASNCFYIVKAGEIDVFKNHGKPNQVQLASIPAGRVLGEIACLDNGPRTATAVAKSEVRVIRVSADTLKWQLQQCPPWFAAVILDIVERLRATNEMLPDNQSATTQMSSMKATDNA
jgi:CRP-like cAMP-binding protein